MKKFLFIALAICVSQAIGQSNLLPVAKNGRWGLVNEQGQFKLEVQYEFIEYAERAQQFVYDYRGKKGILSNEGKVISLPIYEDIQLFTASAYGARQEGKWNLFWNNSPVFQFELDSIVQLTPTNFAAYENGTGHVYFAETGERSADSYQRINSLPNQFILASVNDSLFDLYANQEANPIVKNAIELSPLNRSYGYVHTQENNFFLIDWVNATVLGREMTSISHQYGPWFFYKNDNESYLFSAVENRYYRIPELDYLVNLNFPLAVYNYCGKQGVWDLEKVQSIVPPNFEGALPLDNSFLVSDFNRFGIIAKDGSTLIPLLYQSIDTYDNCYVVQLNGKYGLFSKSGKELCPSVYDRIGVFNSNIKCYKKDELLLIKLNENGGIRDQKTYTNFLSVQVESQRLPRQRSVNAVFGGPNEVSEKNSEAYGWYRPVLTKMKDDSLIEYRGNWGLKDTSDSIWIRPQFAHIKNIVGTDFTKTYRSRPYVISSSISPTLFKKGMVHAIGSGTHGAFQVPLQLVNHKERKMLNSRIYQALNVEDFKDYALARAYDKSLILIDKNGQTRWNELTYYDRYEDDLLLICKGGSLSVHPSKNRNTVCLSSTFFDNLGCAQYKVNPIEKYIEIEDGDWFYITKKGEQLNDTAFQLAQPFEDAMALVKRNNKWGVIDTGMNVIVPLIYEHVERLKINGDTYFRVNNSAKGSYLYNKSTGELTKTDFNEFQHYYEGKWFAKKLGNDNWALVDTNLNELTGYNYGAVQPFTNQWANVIKAGKKTILDPTGAEGLPFFKSKRIEVIGNDLYAIVTSRGMMLINGGSDTLIAENECKKIIETSENYVIYEDRARTTQLLNMKDEKTLPNKTKIAGYALETGLFLLDKGGKLRLYSLPEENYVTKELEQVIEMGNNALIYRGSNGMKGFLAFNGDTLCRAIYEDLEFIAPNLAWGEIGKMKGPVDRNGKFLFTERVFRVRPLNDHFVFTVKEGSGLMNEKCEIIIPPLYTSIAVYNSTFYKCRKADQNCDIYTLDGKQINDRSFKEIKAIEENFLIVKFDNFDYLYNGVLNKSLAFQRIEPISTNLYLLHENAHLGIFNQEGKEIVPVRYHRIELVADKLQVSFFNSFGFYKTDGAIIFDPYAVRDHF